MKKFLKLIAFCLLFSVSANAVSKITLEKLENIVRKLEDLNNNPENPENINNKIKNIETEFELLQKEDPNLENNELSEKTKVLIETVKSFNAAEKKAFLKKYKKEIAVLTALVAASAAGGFALKKASAKQAAKELDRIENKEESNRFMKWASKHAKFLKKEKKEEKEKVEEIVENSESNIEETPIRISRLDRFWNFVTRAKIANSESDIEEAPIKTGLLDRFWNFVSRAKSETSDSSELSDSFDN